jgi:ribosomal protein S27AE
MSIAPAQTPVECPKCGTKQIISDAPGRRICIRCGYEFRPQPQTQKV